MPGRPSYYVDRFFCTKCGRFWHKNRVYWRLTVILNPENEVVKVARFMPICPVHFCSLRITPKNPSRKQVKRDEKIWEKMKPASLYINEKTLTFLSESGSDTLPPASKSGVSG